MSAPSPGWYPDPTTPGSLRFYDGDQWTKSVVTVPANGQLTPDMIATGRKVMQDKASAKLADGPITPRALGSNEDAGASTAHASSTRSARSAASASASAHGSSSGATTRSSLRSSASSMAVGSTGAGDGSHAATSAAIAAGSTAAGSTAAGPKAATAAPSPASTHATHADSSGEAQGTDGASASGKRSAFAPRAFEASTLSSASGTASSTTTVSASESVPLSDSQGSSDSSGVSAASSAATSGSATPKWATDEPQDAHTAAFANDVADSSGTSKPADKSGPSAKILIIAILVVVAVIAAVLFALLGGKEDKAGAPSVAYKALGLKNDFGCEAIAEEVKELSRSGTNEIPVISLKDIQMTNDKRDTFELPTQSGKYTTAFECEGMASYDDGETQKLTFDMSADKAGKLWTYYTPRTK